jgi:general secretion pathway protein I
VAVTPSPRSRTGEKGFTLLEILVALAILSVSLATLLGIFSMSLDRARQSENEMAARVFAQSLIAQADAPADPQLGARGGQSRGYQWRMELRPFAQNASPQTTGMAMASVSATVSWAGSGGQRSLTLYSLRPVPRSATP